MARHALIVAALTAFFAYLFADMLIRHMPVAFDVAIICALAAWVLWLVRHRRHAAPVKLARALQVYWLAMAAAAVFSISVANSLDELFIVTVYIVAYILAEQLSAVWPPRVFLAALRNASWLLIAMIAFITLFSALMGRNLRPPAPNVLAAVFNLLLLPSLVEFAERPRRGLAVWIMAALALIFVTASRGGWLGLAAGLVTLAAHYRARLAVLFGQGAKFWPLAVPLGAIAIVWQVTRIDHSTRWEFWIVALAIFLRRPLVGSGPGTYNVFWSKLHPPPYFQAMHAHSLIFNTGAEQGIIGLIALAVVALAVVRAAWRDAGLLAALMAFAAHSLVDSLNVAPAVMIVLAVLLGSRLGGLNAFKTIEAAA